MKYCIVCSEDVNPKRWALGFKTCLACGEKLAKSVKHCVAPLAKSNYMLISNPTETLKQLNKYAKS